MVDTASGGIVVDLQAHEGAIWSLAVRPDGKGFVTASADKEVKFWDFTVNIVDCLSLVLLHTRSQSVSKFLCHALSRLLSLILSICLYYYIVLSYFTSYYTILYDDTLVLMRMKSRN